MMTWTAEWDEALMKMARFDTRMLSQFDSAVIAFMAAAHISAQGICAFGGLCSKMPMFPSEAHLVSQKSIFEFTMKDIDGRAISLSKFANKIIVLLNVASKCGLTHRNYTELQELYLKYRKDVCRNGARNVCTDQGVC